MSRFSVAGKWCALVWFVLAQPLHAENLVAGINDWLPWQYADHGVASGIVVDIFTDMLEEGAIDNIVRKHIGWWDGHEQRFPVCPAHARNSMPAEMDSDEAR